jgi:hypothetical protein
LLQTIDLFEIHQLIKIHFIILAIFDFHLIQIILCFLIVSFLLVMSFCKFRIDDCKREVEKKESS